MTVEEIFSNICAHMATGLKIHNEIANGFGFLNLRGYQRCHEYHYYEESTNYRCLQNFYSDNYHRLIPEIEYKYENMIPSNWYKYSRENVDVNTKRNAIKDLTKKWVDWETKTKSLYETSYKQLIELNEVYAAQKIIDFLNDVGGELEWAREKYINLESINYDIVSIVEEQDNFYAEYSEKIKKLHKEERK